MAAQNDHMRLHFTSGVLMLCGIHDAHPVEHIVNEQKAPINLRAGQRHDLLDKVNRFKLGKLELRLMYEHTEA